MWTTALHDEFGKTLSYLEDRDLLAAPAEAWRGVLAPVVIPRAAGVSVRFPDGPQIRPTAQRRCGLRS